MDDTAFLERRMESKSYSFFRSREDKVIKLEG
jgi:hypothetical protein